MTSGFFKLRTRKFCTDGVHTWESMPRLSGGWICQECGVWTGNVIPPERGPFPRCEHGYDHPEWAHACDGCFH